MTQNIGTSTQNASNRTKGTQNKAHAPKTAPTGLKGHKKAQPSEITPTGHHGFSAVVGGRGIGEVMSSMSTKKAVWSL